MGAECNAIFHVKYNNVEKLFIILNNSECDLKGFWNRFIYVNQPNILKSGNKTPQGENIYVILFQKSFMTFIRVIREQQGFK